MTIRAIAGLIGFNLALAIVGSGLLWGLRGWRWWTELVRLVGVAYLLGVASFTVLVTFELVVGVPFGWPLLVVAGAVPFAVGIVLGSRRGHVRPALRPPGFKVPRLTLFGALVAGVLLVYFEALFRSGRLEAMSEWDAWRCWTLRAKAIHAGGLDRALFDSAACPGYPPGLSELEAGGFQVMGVVDVVTVHLQYWILLVGFIAALAGLLGSRVRQAVLLPFLLFLLVLPSLTDRVTDGRADLPLDYLLAIGAILVMLWLDDRSRWKLPAATVLFAGVLLTKREGLLLVALVVVAALAATWKDKRSAWPALLATGVVAFALALPWRVWLALEHARTGAPRGGYFESLDHLDRAWPSVKLVVRTFFDYDYWLLAVPLALVAAVLAYVAGSRRWAVFTLVFVAGSVVGFTWVIWTQPELEITQDYGLNPIVRLVGGTTITLVALTALLLERALGSHLAVGASTEQRTEVGSTVERGRCRIALPWAIVAAAGLVFPLSMVVGYSGLRLPGGPPTFPSVEECVEPPVPGAALRVVLGYTESYRDAYAIRRAAAQGRLGSTAVEQDGCGRLRVFVDEVVTEKESRVLTERALAQGLRPSLEADPDT